MLSNDCSTRVQSRLGVSMQQPHYGKATRAVPFLLFAKATLGMIQFTMHSLGQPARSYQVLQGE